MIDIQEFLLHFSLISLVLYFLRSLKKTILGMAIISPSPTPSPSATSSSSPPSPSSFPWLQSLFVEKGQKPFCSKLEKPKESKISSQEKDKDKKIRAFSGGFDDEGDHKRCISSTISRKRPATLVVPTFIPTLNFGEAKKKFENMEFEIEGRDYCVASKKGRRDVMEDSYGAMLDILGDPKQAFFVVIDGHGGNAAADYVAENLGKNIVKELECVERNEGKRIEAAIRQSYSVTDQQFLNSGKDGGACVASALLKDGEVHVANVGDCRVVMSRNGVAVRLTNDHRLTVKDERARVENAGGFVYCHKGIWRVNGSLAVSRAFGDNYLKQWIISEPDSVNIPLTSDCEFLIMASDGLWDKVSDEEAVEVVSKEENTIYGCKKLVDMSTKRGNLDDITVMVINLQSFLGRTHT